MKNPQSCPDAAKLAAFLEGRLRGVDRGRMQKHLLGCDDCSLILAESSSLIDRTVPTQTRQRSWTYTIVAAAAVLVVGAVLVGTWWRGQGAGAPTGLIPTLVAAVGTERSTEARLSGGFAYGPPPVRRRSGEEARPGSERSLRIAAAAAQIESAARAESSAANLHALGLAHLTLGDIDEAVAALERALESGPGQPAILSDLAAALIEKGERQGRTEDYVRSLSLAEEALEADPSLQPARFNRALALEKLHLRERALQAWTEYAEGDAGSLWAEEARRHADSLRRSTSAEEWPADRERLERAARAGDAAGVREIVDRQRLFTREWVRDEGLARWGRDVVRGDFGGAASTLESARIVARSHSELSGDPMCLDMVEAAAAAARAGPRSRQLLDLAISHELLGRAEADMEEYQVERARGLVIRARPGFQGGRSPAILWVDHVLSVADYYREDHEASLRRLERMRLEAEPLGYRSLLGHVHAVEGLIQAVRSRLSEALPLYHQAFAAFTATGDRGYGAFVKGLEGEDLHYLGDHEEEWHRRAAAMADLGFAPPRRAEVILMWGAISALEDGWPRAALHYQATALASAVRRGDAVACSNALQWGALAHYKLGRRNDALSDLQMAGTWASRITDPNLRSRMDSELGYTRGLAASLGDPGPARTELTRALDYFRRSGKDLRLAELFLVRGRLALRSHEDGLAQEDFDAGIATFERQRLALLSAPDRISFFDTAGELFDEAIGLHEQRGSAESALALAERGRARQLLEALPVPAAPMEIPRIRAQLPEGTAVVEYASLPDRLVIWVLTASGTDAVDSPAGEARLQRLVGEFRASLQDPAKADEARRAASDLSDILIRPVEAKLEGSRTLVFVPDKALHALPFAALVGRGTDRYLVETHEIVLAPSATAFVQALGRQKRIGAGARSGLLAIGDPSFDRKLYPNLPRLAAASEEVTRISELYPRYRLLKEEQATKAAFLDDGPRYSVIHYAGHAISHDSDPYTSRFVLAADPARGDDGTLLAQELYGRRFDRTRLVVLAACATATGRISRGEGAMSLARPFLAAGVPSVIASLWDIPDRASSELAIRLHRRLASGDTPQSALRTAQLELLRDSDPALSSPGVWAAFELIGAASVPLERGGVGS